MAFVLKDVAILINGTAVSDHASNVNVESTFAEVDVTAFGVNAAGAKYKEYEQGLGDATVTFNVFQDYAVGSIDSIFWPLSQTGGTFGLEIRPFSTAVSSTNPKYTMTGKIFNFNPLGGDVGAASATTVTIRNAGTAGLIRGTV